MDATNRILQPVEGDMQRYIQLFNSSLQSPNPLLNLALSHLVKRQGKRMRPVLTLLASRYVGQPTEASFHAAVSFELLHTASLVHDDVVDDSDQRRGQRSVNNLLGNKEAVLVGDFLLSKAMEHTALTGNLEVVRMMAVLGQTLADGELLQLDLTQQSTLDIEQYFHVIDGKTASLFVACAQAGALLGDAPEEARAAAVRTLTAFAGRVGRVFQLRDDIFDYDTDNQAGKPVGNDLREGKLTLPLLYALEKVGTEDDRAVALRVRRGEATEDEIARMVSLAREGGGIDYAHSLMRQMTDEAIALLDKEKAPADVVDALSLYARFVAGRNV